MKERGGEQRSVLVLHHRRQSSCHRSHGVVFFYAINFEITKRNDGLLCCLSPLLVEASAQNLLRREENQYWPKNQCQPYAVQHHCFGGLQNCCYIVCFLPTTVNRYPIFRQTHVVEPRPHRGLCLLTLPMYQHRNNDDISHLI